MRQAAAAQLPDDFDAHEQEKKVKEAEIIKLPPWPAPGHKAMATTDREEGGGLHHIRWADTEINTCIYAELSVCLIVTSHIKLQSGS